VVRSADAIFPDKLPSVVFHFVFASLISGKFRRIYRVLAPKIEANLPYYTANQILDVLYSYARLHEEARPLFLAAILLLK